jgi:hypothetical protein
MADVELSEIASIMAGNDPEPVVEIPEPVEAEQSEEIQTASEEPEQAEAAVEIPTRLTVTEIAEKLDLTPEQLYSALQIKVGDSEVSLSTLKDGVNDLERANELRESAQSHKTEAKSAGPSSSHHPKAQDRVPSRSRILHSHMSQSLQSNTKKL